MQFIRLLATPHWNLGDNKKKEDCQTPCQKKKKKKLEESSTLFIILLTS